MHEGDHGIIEDAQEEFEAKFGCSDCQTTGQGQHSHHHHDRTIKIVAGVIVLTLAVVFIVFKVI